MTPFFLSRLLVMTLSFSATSVMAKNHPPINFVGCQRNETLFFAYTKDRQQAVEVCKLKTGYRYTYGQFTIEGKHLKQVKDKSIQKTFTPGDAGSIHRDEAGGFAIKDGDTFIWLEAEISGELNLVTATSGWDGWEMAVNRKAVPLDIMGRGFINQIDTLNMVPFNYDYTHFDQN